MKTIFFLFFISLTFSGFYCQVEGDIKTENRNCLTNNFSLVASQTGTAIFSIAVDRSGKVTSAKLISQGTSIKGTPNLMRCKNFVLKLKFEGGSHYPKYHQGKVTVNFVTEENSKP